ncbi:MAG: hypothetical protein JXA67_21075, partial [Micromonosporaceae bacterium]|nr:hypothetical protein [Micromonosporaceae bacterium]
KAVERITTAMTVMDDSSGIVGDDLYQIMGLYARACVAAPPKPKRLAGWLVKLECDGPGWPEIRLREFAPALGPAGIAEVTRLVDQRAATADPGSWMQTFAIRDLREQLAEVSGDVDRHVAVLAQHLESIRQYRRIVAALRQAGRIDDALHWARRGLADKPGWPEASHLRNTLVDLLLDSGQPQAAIDARRQEFTRHPTLTTWHALHATATVATATATTATAATAAGTTATATTTVDAAPTADNRDETMVLREWALETLRQRAEQQPPYLRELVAVLLDVGEANAAWQAAAGRGDVIGQHLWLQLLEVRRTTHPADTLDAYRQLIEDQILDSRDKHRYRRAVALLRQLRLAHLDTHDPAGFGDYLDQLRIRHRRRPTFLSTLDRTRW